MCRMKVYEDVSLGDSWFCSVIAAGTFQSELFVNGVKLAEALVSTVLFASYF